MLLINYIFTLLQIYLTLAKYIDLAGDQVVTCHDYEGMDPISLKNPPSCGYDYSKLDLTRVTAVQGLSKSQCGSCLRVSNPSDPSNWIHVLVIDTGGRGLDLSTSAFIKLFNSTDHPSRAMWYPVESDNCEGIYQE
ncbi:hypothetical protein CONCODRAFT_13215 [Conidiobolus coronatus NRRL 28638]|uniref:Expansin-like EG45 domain-containing protein n=1 Tax=Conidiobolus coronatus (strain ATCC 28846 / CBS 209.66 / NRRL 28638) TaxID=796925 RepID=A0A137NRB1_CONC2|nr:hypothetical protein CONCODRAFT_13215 [Conidiobolus coronatus NRRL 28638]|eukprot:KXN65262.1 hypothetical protein CONCODRAFT_13215 [Conidiobolus coronatus NRRL 28638]